MLLTSIPASFKIETLKIQRTSAFWLTAAGALFVPLLMLIAYTWKPESSFLPKTSEYNAWSVLFTRGWQVELGLFLPFYVVLINSLVLNIEHRSNTWKYVWTQPFSKASIWIGKLLVIQSLVLLHFVLFILLQFTIAGILSILDSRYGFGNHSPDFQEILKFTIKVYIGTLAVSGIHYWLSTRLQNLIIPIGIALMGIIVSTILIQVRWEYIDWFPYAYSSLNIKSLIAKSEPLFDKHEWISIGYFVVFSVLGYVDISRRNMG